MKSKGHTGNMYGQCGECVGGDAEIFCQDCYGCEKCCQCDSQLMWISEND